MYTQDYDEVALPSGLYGMTVPGILGGGPYTLWCGEIRYPNAASARPEATPLWPYMKNTSFTGCPSAMQVQADWWGYTHYGYNAVYIGGYGDYMEAFMTIGPRMTKTPSSLAAIDVPTDTVLFGDSGYDNGAGGAMRYPWLFPPSSGFGSTSHARHSDTSVVSYVDGHVKATKLVRLPTDPPTTKFGFVSKTGAVDDSAYNGTGAP
jgi:prepilin-type processing-associated H-X9-DG protein